MAVNAAVKKPSGLLGRKSGADVSRLFVHAVLIGLGFFYMYPFLWVLASSFKTPS
jgi:ABC-type glycerol-3-phosphate transport system permease component